MHLGCSASPPTAPSGSRERRWKHPAEELAPDPGLRRNPAGTQCSACCQTPEFHHVPGGSQTHRCRPPKTRNVLTSQARPVRIRGGRGRRRHPGLDLAAVAPDVGASWGNQPSTCCPVCWQIWAEASPHSCLRQVPQRGPQKSGLFHGNPGHVGTLRCRTWHLACQRTEGKPVRSRDLPAELCVRGSGGLGLAGTSRLVLQLLRKRQQAQGPWSVEERPHGAGPPAPRGTKPKQSPWRVPEERGRLQGCRQEFRAGCTSGPSGRTLCSP